MLRNNYRKRVWCFQETITELIRYNLKKKLEFIFKKLYIKKYNKNILRNIKKNKNEYIY